MEEAVSKLEHGTLAGRIAVELPKDLGLPGNTSSDFRKCKTV